MSASKPNRDRARSRIVLADHQPQIERLQRRLFLRSSLSIGALAMLSGCNMQDGDSVDKVLWAMSRWNDRVQGWLFDRNKLAPTYSARKSPTRSRSTRSILSSTRRTSTARRINWKCPGSCRTSARWNLDQLRALPQASQITRHICIEGWSAIGQWRGVPFRDVSGARRRRSERALRRLQMRGPLLLQPRHGNRPASADATHARLPQ